MYLEPKNFEGAQILVASFTYPLSLRSICEPTVDHWVDNFRLNWTEYCFKVEAKVVNLDTVVI